jgi:6-phosphogluconate dehydrogenase
MSKAAFGVIGLGTMGRNLALNIESRGVSVAVWNRELDWTETFVRENADRAFTSTDSLEGLVEAVEHPRRILMMIPAGAPVDEMIDRLRPLLERGDVLVDGGNSWFEDTERREKALRGAGIHFVGCGVSGGEDGARNGPSLMPGGSTVAWTLLQPVLEAIAARTEAGPCVTHVGPGGAGHFVKMVHNGIEYADMQLIAESWDLMRRVCGMSAAETADVFAEWNRGPLESFLIELSSQVCRVKDPVTGGPLVDVVLDKAGQKGTGKWTVQAALEIGIAVPTIAAALDARVLSSLKDERVAAAQVLRGPAAPPRLGREDLLNGLPAALYASRICVYAQGFALISAASRTHEWQIDLAEVARIWKAGCIIRARLLDPLRHAFASTPGLANALVDPALAEAIDHAQAAWRQVVSAGGAAGIPLPAHATALAYFDSYRSAQLPQNLTQAQRDAFGAHTYERTDTPGKQHSGW